MRILFPTAEAAPIYKVGGLGDVAGSLPKALKRLGYDARLVLPKYAEIEVRSQNQEWRMVDEFKVIFEHKIRPVKIWEGKLPDSEVPVYLFEEEWYLSRQTGNFTSLLDQFAFFSQAVTTWLAEEISGWQPQIIHLHDWHVALIPLLLKQKYPGKYGDYRTLLTVHNLAHQGISGLNLLDRLGLKSNACRVLAWDAANGDVDILLEGMIHADLVSTVSPTYAEEILQPEYGMNLDQTLEGMKGKITGILNGLDIELWNPETDEALVKKFSVNNWLEGKRASKLSVQNETGLAVDQDRILIGFVGRLDPIQKGVGLILEAIGSENTEGRIQNTEIQFVVLGTGDPNLENQLRKAANTFENFAAVIKFDNGLARRIYAGCDFLLVPSKFEPCGLIQMIAMRYGAIPIVRNTGGLKDTVREEETGFLFPDYTMKSMMGAVSKAIDLYADHAKREQMVRNCMSEDFSWNKSAKEYVMLYEKLVMEE